MLGDISREKGGGKIVGGNNIYFGSGCKVIGNIRIGDNVQIGANAVVIKDIPNDTTCVRVPGRNIANESVIHKHDIGRSSFGLYKNINEHQEN